MSEIFYEEVDTDKSLADFAKRFWKFSNPTVDTQHYTILPDGYFDLIITIKANKLDSITLFGLWTKEIEIARVLKPNGTALIGAYIPTTDYAKAFTKAGLTIKSSKPYFTTAYALMWIVEATK